MSNSSIAIVRAVSRLPLTLALTGGSVLFVLLLSLSGCGKTPQDKLEGKWVGSQIDNVSVDQMVRATAWVKATTFEFVGDKLTVTIPAEPSRKGTFKVAQAETDKVVLSVARPGTSLRDQVTFTMQGDKAMRWDIGDNREVVLVRAQ